MARKKKIDKEMGFRLKKARTDQKLTYEELAEKSGVSSRYIKEIENHGTPEGNGDFTFFQLFLRLVHARQGEKILCLIILSLAF